MYKYNNIYNFFLKLPLTKISIITDLAPIQVVLKDTKTIEKPTHFPAKRLNWRIWLPSSNTPV